MKIYEILKEENVGKICIVDKEINPWYMVQELGKTSYIVVKNGHGQISLYNIEDYDKEMELYGEPVLIDSSYIMSLEFTLTDYV